MNSTKAELAAALRQRLAIVADETSRRDPERHLEKLKSVSEKIDGNWENRSRRRSIRSSRIFSRDAATTRLSKRSKRQLLAQNCRRRFLPA